MNGPLWAQGKIGNGVRFDGIDDAVRITSNSQANNLQAFTFTAWIYPTKNGGIIFRKGAGAAAYINIFTMQDTGQGDTGQLGMRIPYTNQTGVWKTKTVIPLNSWHHVAIKYERANINAVPSFYVDGILQEFYQTAAPDGVSVSDDESAFIGNNQTLTANSGVFGGIIDEVRLYNRILSPDQITTIWNLGLGGGVSLSRPNIVVIMTDDQDDIGSMAVMAKVNNLIVNQGVSFKNSFVSDPQCCPSRAGFMTGQYAHNNGVRDNGEVGPGGYQAFAPTANNSMPVWLQQAGYNTALIGKYLNGYEGINGEGKIPPGWSNWYGLVDTYKWYNFRINENGTIRAYGSSAEDYQTDVLSRKAVDYINSRAISSQPFFLWLTPLAQHVGFINDGDTSSFVEPAPRHKGMLSSLPLPQPPSFNEADMSDKPSFIQARPVLDAGAIRYVTKRFQDERESLLAVDDMVANVIEALRQSGKLDNTIIVFTSDNGMFHGEHRHPGGKRDFNEESTRVPLIIRGPGVAKGEICSQLVNNLDLTATIVDAAGAIPGRALDSRSLKPLFSNAGTPWRTALLFEAREARGWDLRTTFALYAAVRTERFAYAEHAGASSVDVKELYDLRLDPYETQSQHLN